MEEARHVIALHALEGGAGADGARGEIARALGGGSVGDVTEGQMLELEVSAPTREEALRVVRDAIAAAGADHLFSLADSRTD